MRQADKDILRRLLQELVLSQKDTKVPGLTAQENKGIKPFTAVEDLLNKVGFEVEAHQEGIRGTFIALVPVRY